MSERNSQCYEMFNENRNEKPLSFEIHWKITEEMLGNDYESFPFNGVRLQQWIFLLFSGDGIAYVFFMPCGKMSIEFFSEDNGAFLSLWPWTILKVFRCDLWRVYGGISFYGFLRTFLEGLDVWSSYISELFLEGSVTFFLTFWGLI